ncbi:glycoside hydrolase family 15 protein [Acidisphaera rubrifaciens]|uniref:Trehalase n=1 Tax=Acidisphaera rubrifaciens HS-AP3 TaxID=1231350 RepID=A0A0D6P3D6_9PROT|nr:glycoside hydrolase family 15 protein [Acidisphaera rubrifaciens]GAN76162.1 glycoside hydrolase [Acidisphaera rubrifaciens HS-AP3]
MTDHDDVPPPIEDYAMIGDCRSAALVSRDGAIDWLCWPRFDSDALFARLLGTRDNGTWRIGPRDTGARITRRYRPGTMILETTFTTPGGTVRLTDFMPPGSVRPSVVRIIDGVDGSVEMALHVTVRFGYGDAVPWVTRLHEEHGLRAVVGPDMVVLRGPVPLEGEAMSSVAHFTVAAGERLAFVLTHGPSHRPMPEPLDAAAALSATDAYWTEWSGRMRYEHRYQDAVSRSLLTLKALTYAPTGGIVAAPTSSLPEQLGGPRNWDYRFCWLRDATLTLVALLHAGYTEEAAAWRAWLQRSVAGSPAQVQIMYGIGGERRLTEWEASWLPGYQGARPVRIGNAAHGQLQLDVYGEVMDALYQARSAGLPVNGEDVALQAALLDHLAEIWDQPDEGIWEVRGGRRHFTFSKVMAWVAFDRAVRSAEEMGLDLPLDRMRALRDRVHADVCAHGYSPARGAFTQSYGEPGLDASLLLLPIVGFLPHDDPRVRGTVAAIERELVEDGFVLRYRTEEGKDGLPPGEGVFLACSFWLADNMVLQGRIDEARALFERLLSLRNDVGLLSEEYDPKARRLVGNFPQAFSHLALLHTAFHLAEQGPLGLRD